MKRPGDDIDIGDVWRDVRKDRQTQHAHAKDSNTNLIRSTGFTFASTNQGECLCFRSAGKPAVDFYPSTGRWRVVHSGRMHGGGAQRFIDWYRDVQ